MYYDLSSSDKLVTAIDEDSNNEIEGMWTKITTYGVPIANGFTQVDQQVSSWSSLYKMRGSLDRF